MNLLGIFIDTAFARIVLCGFLWRIFMCDIDNDDDDDDDDVNYVIYRYTLTW